MAMIGRSKGDVRVPRERYRRQGESKNRKTRGEKAVQNKPSRCRMNTPATRELSIQRFNTHEQLPMVSARLMSRAYPMPTHKGSLCGFDEEGNFGLGRKLEALGCASAFHSRTIFIAPIADLICTHARFTDRRQQ